MSNGNNRNDDVQDYFDLLKSPEDSQNKGDIDRFFEGSEKVKPKKPSPPPMVEKPKGKPEAKKSAFTVKIEDSDIKKEQKIQVPSSNAEKVPVKAVEVASKTQEAEKKPKQPTEKTEKISLVESKNQVNTPVSEKKEEASEESKPKKPTVDVSIIESFEGIKTQKASALPENAPFKAEIIEDNEDEKAQIKEKEKNPFKRLSIGFNNLPKKKKIIVSILIIILAFILILVSVAGIFVKQKFSLMGDSFDNPYFDVDDDVIYEDEEIGDIEIDIGSAGFKQSLIDWATTGNDKHMSSKNVINVLLIGADSRKGKNEGNTDVMMLVSVNKKTKTLKMVSFLRDSYLYIEGDENSYCTKLNAAYSMGGPECLIKTIENNYKIAIDNYVMVNFESFKGIVDAMGGITVDVQEYEANYMIKRFELSDMPCGEGVTLNGKQALAFCRARGCDSDGDVSRTRRQRQIIDSMVDRVMKSSISEINKYIDVLLPYVDTGYSESQIISLGLRAITGGWAKYERTQLSMPSEDCRTSGDANMWIWVADYQKAAQQLQMELYGKTNIEIDENAVSIIDVYKGANYSGSSSSVKDSDDEPEVPDTTKKQSTSDKTTKPQADIPSTTKKPDVNKPAIDETQEPSTEDVVEEPDVTEGSSDNGVEFEEEPATQAPEEDNSGEPEKLPEGEDPVNE